jgi:alpha-L-rhamnosidase
MYRVIAGIEIDPSQPGYKHVLIQPHPGGGLTSTKASVHTMYGKVASSWEVKDGTMTMEVEIPANTTATVRLPGGKLEDVTESGKTLGSALANSGAKQVDGAVVFDAGSGTYEFVYKYGR